MQTEMTFMPRCGFVAQSFFRSFLPALLLVSMSVFSLAYIAVPGEGGLSTACCLPYKTQPLRRSEFCGKSQSR